MHYPGLSEHPQHALATQQLRQYGSVLSFEVADRNVAAAVMGRLRVARLATSLGGPETIVCHPATSTHASLTPSEMTAAGLTDGLLRVSIGLEDPGDIVNDFVQALESPA